MAGIVGFLCGREYQSYPEKKLKMMMNSENVMRK